MTYNGQPFGDPVNGAFDLSGNIYYVNQTAVITFQALVNSVTQGATYNNHTFATGETLAGAAIQADSSAWVPNDDDPTDTADVVVYGPLTCSTESTNVAFEDLKNTGWSDWDYNDLIVQIDTDLCNTNSGDAGIIELHYTAIARGAGYRHSFWHDLPLEGSGRYELTIYDHTGQVISYESDTFVTIPDFQIFADSKQIFEETGGDCLGEYYCLSYVNTFQSDTTYRDGSSAHLTVVLNTPILNPVAELSAVPWDPYIYVYETGEEVHRIIPGPSE